MSSRTEVDVWQRLHEVLLAKLRTADALDFSLAVVDSSYVRALRRGRLLEIRAVPCG